MAPTETPAEDAYKIITEHNHTPKSGVHSTGWLWVASGEGKEAGGGGRRQTVCWLKNWLQAQSGLSHRKRLVAAIVCTVRIWRVRVWKMHEHMAGVPQRARSAEWQCARELRTISLMKMCVRVCACVRTEACAKVVVVAVGLSRTRISRPVVPHMQGNQTIGIILKFQETLNVVILFFNHLKNNITNGLNVSR